MIQGLMGEKIGMTQIYLEDGSIVPVTVIEAGPCQVVQKKGQEPDGYQAFQLSFKPKKEKNTSKGMLGHFKKAGVSPARFLKEFQGDESETQVGQEIRVDIFKKGELVDVTGISRGKGFAGAMKRHHFAGGPATHGSMFHREPGSIGASSFPSRVMKNKRLPGQMGNVQRTIEKLEIIQVQPDENILMIKGAVPGSPGTLLVIKRSKKVS
ncbi:MAG TPA: 50S ribosomal protein L3 [Nitrospiria bacterium]|jgi:large subunit ribosomal protein L3